MNSKRFDYQHKDIPMLRKNIVLRALFAVMFAAVFVWQLITMITIKTDWVSSIIKLTCSVFVIIFSLLFSFVSLMYALKYFRIISVIKMKGRCVSSVELVFSTKKNGFLKLYSIVSSILTLLTSLVLICVITYAILEATYYSSISFFMPILIFICLSGYNSIYQISDEMNTQKHVEEYNSLFN
ncbi:MAG: hypothetical protein E7351_02675 [Clostridiales bacterium]|nr:hypothetical protein [Clostridiales bacterium]